MDIQKIKQDFPIFQRKINGKEIVYLDSAATSQKPYPVLDALDDFYKNHNANIHRGIYTLSEEATEQYEGARKKVADFIHSSFIEQIVFTRNTTEAINLVAYSWGLHNLTKNDTIILSIMEHHSNIVPWQMVQQKTGCNIVYIGIDAKTGLIDMDTYKMELAKGNVRLVSMAHVSNVLGSINPIEEIVQLAHQNGALILVDAAQSVPHRKVNVHTLDPDFLAFSGHKMLGPTGIGVLFAKKELLEEMPPFLMGGDMIEKVTVEETTYAQVPSKFEAGTPHIAGAIGLAHAIEYLETIGMDAIEAHEQTLTAYALERLKEIEDIRIFGPHEIKNRGGVISFCLKGIHPHDIAQILNHHNIAIRAGHHCAMPLTTHLGEVASARASFYLYNTTDDVDQLMKGLTVVQQTFVHHT